MSRAIIVGCRGTELDREERALFASEQPLGFILFRRNIAEPAQVRALVDALRDAVGRPDAPVLIDQEGGRVARLKAPHWPELPAARRVGALAERDGEAGHRAARLQGLVIGAMLSDLGIDVACAPVLDLLHPETHAVIGDRAYGADPILAASLGRAMSAGLVETGVTPIVKHIPGHGRATADSHLELPVVNAGRDALDATDFSAFAAPHPAAWAMVAHVVYAAVDRDRPASVSPDVIALIRGEMGFDGVLIADDIDMKALTGELPDRARATLAAGCDLTLQCSGDFAATRAVLPSVPAVSDVSRARLAASRAAISDAARHDPARLAAELGLLVSEAA